MNALAGLNDDGLFQRLFIKRYAPDNDLLLAAEACALVYSFDGAVNGDWHWCRAAEVGRDLRDGRAAAIQKRG